VIVVHNYSRTVVCKQKRQLLCAGTSSAYQQREQGIQSQLEALKSLSRDAHSQALSEAQQASSSLYTSSDEAAANDTKSLRQRLEAAIEEMSEGLVERDTEVRLLLLAALAGEHILFIGPPGTAKSELGRRLSRLCHGMYFERLLTRFSVPEELFGPLSMRALEEDKYIRQTAGYLPEATVAFIDEIFKANSAILNTLLTLLNERLFDNGAKRAPVPLLCLVGASNELPESEELDALYDRFLLRRRVSQVSPSGLLEMLGSSRSSRKGQALVNVLAHPGVSSDSGGDFNSAPPLISSDDFYKTRLRAEQSVSVPPSVLNIIADLRSFLQDKCEPPVYVSDRRLVKAVGMMQVAAYTSGRTVVSELDCLLLQHVLWQRPEEAERIYDWLLTSMAADDGLQQVQYLLAGMFGRACRSLGNERSMRSLADEVAQLRETLVAKLAAVYSSTTGGGPKDNLWLGRDEAEAVSSALLPKLEKTAKEVETLLFEVVTLEVGCFSCVWPF
jgi:MoxR-like ATPase